MLTAALSVDNVVRKVLMIQHLAGIVYSIYSQQKHSLLLSCVNTSHTPPSSKLASTRPDPPTHPFPFIISATAGSKSAPSSLQCLRSGQLASSPDGDISNSPICRRRQAASN